MIPVISVIICTYNRYEILKKCLPHIFHQSLPSEKYEVIIIDDGSTDKTKDISLDFSNQSNFYYFYKENGGLASARNSGLKYARGEYVFFTDDDIFADYFLLEEHLKAHKNSDRLVVNGWVNHFSENIPDKPSFTFKDISFSFFWTSNVSLKKKYIDEAGKFDEDFKEYGWEDLELGLRLRKQGLKSLFHRKAIAYHYKKKLTYRDFPGVLRQAEAKGRSAVIFLKKNNTWRVRLTTGFFTPRLQLNLLLFSNVFVKNFIYKTLSSQNPDKNITYLHNIYLRQLSLVVYYEAVIKGL